MKNKLSHAKEFESKDWEAYVDVMKLKLKQCTFA